MRLYSIIGLLIVWPLVASAGTGAVNKWVDANGVTHYSDEAPAADATEVTSVEVTVNYNPPAEIEDDYYSVANQWKRMQAERVEMAKIKLEREQIRAKAQPEVVYVNNEYRPRVIGYPFWYIHQKRHHRRFGARPGHPIAMPHGSSGHGSFGRPMTPPVSGIR